MALNDNHRAGVSGNADRDPDMDRLYRAAGGESPPAHLDAAILAAAHREVGARPQSRHAALRRWQVPVSIAAVVVLSVSLVTLVNEEGGDKFMPDSPPPAPAEAPVAKLVQPAPAVPKAEKARPPVVVSETARPAPREEAPAGAPAALGRMADSLASGADPKSLQAQGAAAESARDTAVRSRPQPFRDAVSPAERRAAPAEEAVPRIPAAAERDRAPMAAAPAPEPARARDQSQAGREAASVSEKLHVWQGYEKEPPQKWLDRIAELKQQERAAEAAAMLAEFKRRFPNHPLPPASR